MSYGEARPDLIQARAIRGDAPGALVDMNGAIEKEKVLGDSYTLLSLYLNRASCTAKLENFAQTTSDLKAAQELFERLKIEWSDRLFSAYPYKSDIDIFGDIPGEALHIGLDIQIAAQQVDLHLARLEKNRGEENVNHFDAANAARMKAENLVENTAFATALNTSPILLMSVIEYELQSAKFWEYSANKKQKDNIVGKNENYTQANRHLRFGYADILEITRLAPNSEWTRFMRWHYITIHDDLMSRIPENYFPDDLNMELISSFTPRPVMQESTKSIEYHLELQAIKSHLRTGNAHQIIKCVEEWQQTARPEPNATPEELSIYRYFYMECTQLMAHAHLQLGDVETAREILTNNLPADTPDWIKNQTLGVSSELIYQYRNECLKRIELSTDLMRVYQNFPMMSNAIYNQTEKFLKEVTKTYKDKDPKADINYCYAVAAFFNARSEFLFAHDDAPKAETQNTVAAIHADALLNFKPGITYGEISELLPRTAPVYPGRSDHWDLKARILINTLKQLPDTQEKERLAIATLLWWINLPQFIHVETQIEAYYRAAQVLRGFNMNEKARDLIDFAQSLVEPLEGFESLKIALKEELDHYQTANQPHQPQTG